MSTAKPTELFEAFATKSAEGLGLWAEANQKVLRQLVDISTAAAAEGVSVYTALQTTAVRAARTGQDYVLAQGARLKDVPVDPARAYQRTLSEGIEAAQETFKVLGTTAETLTKSAERLQQSANQAGKAIQSTLATLGSDLKSLYTPADGATA